MDRYRVKYVESLLQAEKGELTKLEQDVLSALESHETVAENLDADYQEQTNLGQRLADHFATFGGSWKFIIAFAFVLISWIVMNSLALASRPFDPYPFILLNLILSCLAAIQAPIIMMSQNRLEAKDRLRENMTTGSISKPNWRSEIFTRKWTTCFGISGSGWLKSSRFNWRFLAS